MKNLVQAFIIAFSMYSKIPMPKMDWTEKGMKYAICFFPAVGAVVGIIMYAAGVLLHMAGVSPLLFGCIMTVIPVFITGGIHLDGFLDTMDGISSYADKQKRLEILKDSNSGAFAIIGGLVYFTLSVGFFSEVTDRMLPIIAVGFMLSRALSGFAMVTFPKARKNGLVATFSNGADQKIVRITMIIYVIIALATAFYISIPGAVILMVTAAVMFIYHYWNCMHNFGGITGDLAGFFLQIFELLVVIVLVIGKSYF